MLILLYILLVLDIFSLIICFIMLLSNSVLYALIFAGIGFLQIVPIIAIIFCIHNIDKLQDHLFLIRYKVKNLEDENNKTKETENLQAPAVDHQNTAIGSWKCIKCDTINKPNTSHCSNCKAEYSPIINPTADPYAKKKISKWIKFK